MIGEEEQRRRSWSDASALTQNHILEIRALAVDALGRRRDPSCNFARLVHRLHQLGIARAVFFGRQPFAAVRRELLGRKQVSVRVAALPRIRSDLAIEARVRERETLPEAAR